MIAPRPTDVLEPDGPSTATFFRGERHWSDPPDVDATLIAAMESRLGVALPGLLRDLYHVQNGGGSDFAFSAIAPDAPLAPADDLFAHWRDSLPDGALLPVGDLRTMTALQATFDHDPDHAWAARLPGADRLVRIAQQAWDVYLCLDYGDGRTEPRVVLFDDVRWAPGSDAPFEAVWPDFATFFAGLRRLTLTEQDGALYRGIMPAGPRDRAEAGSR